MNSGAARPWVAAAVLLGALALGWRWMSPGPRGESTRAPAGLSTMPWLFSQLDTAAAGSASGAAGPTPMANGPGPAAVSVRAPRVHELCGVGRWRAAPGPAASAGEFDVLDELPPHLGTYALEQARQRLQQSLSAGGPRGQAVALLMFGHGASGPTLETLAQQSKDAAIAMWATQRCGRTPGGCTGELARLWMKLEPDNLAAGLSVAALQPQHVAAFLQNLATTATRYEGHETAISQTVLQAMPADIAPYLQLLLWIEAIGVEVAMPVQVWSPLMHQCPGPPPAAPVPAAATASSPATSPRPPEPGLPPFCAELARVLVAAPRSAMARGLGLRLAERTYMAPADAARERKALNELMSHFPHFQDEQPLSCQAVAHARQWIDTRAQFGELEAARRAAAAASAASAADPRNVGPAASAAPAR